MSIFDLSGRVAIITGGNGGIGLGIAQALAEAGCNVSIWGRNAEKNKSAAATMAGAAGKVDARICDVTDVASVKAAMAATLERFGRVDGCFANAGIGGGGRHAFIDRTEEQWRNMFATNLDGVFHVFQAAARHMTERATAGDKFAGWSRLPASPRCSAPRVTSTTPRPRPLSTRWSVLWRSNWRGRASPPTRSCPAGSRAT